MHNIPATGKRLMAKKPQGLRRAEQNESLVRDIHIIAPERKEKKKKTCNPPLLVHCLHFEK